MTRLRMRKTVVVNCRGGFHPTALNTRRPSASRERATTAVGEHALLGRRRHELY